VIGVLILFKHRNIIKYRFDEIPINEECLLMSEIYMKEYDNALVKMFEGANCNPYEVGCAGFVAVRQINENSMDLSWYLNTSTRFHEVSISLPKDKFKICVGCYGYDIRPHLFVDNKWLEQLYTREYSVFALIDAIDVKIAIRNNLLTKEKLLLLRNRLDSLAKQHKNISFISFADSLILKSNWSAGYFPKTIKCSYEPEVFLRIIKEIETIYSEVLSLHIYAVLTQGSNEYYNEPLLHISNSKNHICLNSLGVPFAELMAIEKSVKAAIKKKIHPPAQVYMDEQYYYSLNLKYEFKENSKPKNEYKAIMKTEQTYYFYSSCDELLSNLRK
jgi:hypothetical protein